MTDTMLAEFSLVLFDNMTTAPGQLYLVGHNPEVAWISPDPIPASDHPEVDLHGAARQLTRLVLFPRETPARWGEVVDVGDTPSEVRPRPEETAPPAAMTAFFEALLTFTFWPERAQWLNALRIVHCLPAWPSPS